MQKKKECNLKFKGSQLVKKKKKKAKHLCTILDLFHFGE